MGYGSGLYGSGIYPGSTQDIEFRKFSVTPILLVEMRFPSGTRYVSNADARYNSVYYEGRLLSMSPIRREIQRQLGLYEVNAVTAEISDTDQSFSSIVEPIKGTVVVVKLLTRILGISDAKTLLIGKIDDYEIADFSMSFVIKDAFLDIPEFPDTGFVDETNFPNAYKEHRGAPLPICYGTHSIELDDDFRNRGAWPTLYVDNTADSKKFLIAAHAVKAINKVYTNRPTLGSTELTLTTDYTVFPAGVLAGKTMAWIQFTTSQFNSKVVDGSSIGQVVCNVAGKEVTGTGSGSLITNPIDVLLDFLANYCGNPTIDGTTMTESQGICTGRSYLVKGGYFEKSTTQNVLADLVRSFNISLFLTSEGSVASNMVDASTMDSGGDLFDEARDIFKGSWSIDRNSQIEGAEDSQLVNSIDYSYDFHYAKNKSFRSNKTTDSESISKYGTKSLVLDMPWNASSTNAGDVASRIIFQFKNPVAHASFRTIIKAVQTELAQRFLASHANGHEGTAWSSRGMQMLSQVFNPADFSVQIRGRDINAITEGAYYFGAE